jgi:hypothetical protein
MLPLPELQKQFVQGLNSQNTAILELIRATDTLAAEEQFAIYKSSIKAALQGGLKEIYPVCNKLVGDDFFIAMINGYIAQHPSQSPDLAGYGKDLPSFIANFAPAKSLPYLVDIAQLEWAWHILFTAGHSQGINYSKLAACYATQGAQIIFNLPTASTLLASAYPIHLVWQANQENHHSDQIITLPDNSQFYYLVWRKELTQRIDLITVTEWQILNWIQTKLNLDEVYRRITTNFPAIKFEALLLEWVKIGWIASFEIGATPCH